MKKEEFMNALGEIRDDLLEEAEQASGKKKGRSWLFPAAGIAAAAAIALLVIPGIRQILKPAVPMETSVGDADHFTTPEGYVWTLRTGSGTSPHKLNEIAVELHWEEKTDPQRYLELTFGGEKRQGQAAVVSESDLGEKLGEGSLSGYDGYADRVNTVTSEIRAIKGIDPVCAVAAQFPDGTFGAFRDMWYQPATWREFAEALSLKENLVFGSAEAVYKEANGRRHTVYFDAVPADFLKETLLNSPESAVNDPDGAVGIPEKLLSISVDVPVLGIKNVGLWFCDDGTMCTNILGTLKRFEVGQETVRSVVEKIYAGGEGYELTGPSIPVPENGGENAAETAVPMETVTWSSAAR